MAQTVKIAGHPVWWQATYQALSRRPAPGKIAMGRRVLEAIEERADPDDAWPDPWQRGLPQELRDQFSKKHPFDKGARVEIEFTIEQAEWLKETLVALENNAETTLYAAAYWFEPLRKQVESEIQLSAALEKEKEAQ